MRKTTFLTLVLVLITVALASAADRQSNPNVSPQYVPNEIIIKFKKPAADIIEGGMFAGKQVRSLKLSDSLDELHKKYQVRSAKALFGNFRKKRQQTKALLQKDKTLLTKTEKRIIKRLARAQKSAKVPELDRIYKFKIKLGDGQSLEEVVTAYNNDPGVEYAELNYMISIGLTPNDPLYSIQWPLNNTGQMYPYSGTYNSPPGTPDSDIDAPQAWDIHTGSSEIIVAVVDTGVDYTHRDLDENMWTDANGCYGYDFVNEDNDPIDDHGHGTHCSGIIAAEGNNGLDIAGVCFKAKIMALKMLDADGWGPTSNAVSAFNYAVDNGADVISNSWGGYYYSETLKQAIDYVYSQGVMIVAAAGNDNISFFPHYPAYYNHVISVAATNSNDDKASFSNYGSWVDIAAPGVDVLSLRAGGTSMGTIYDSYTTIASGTSMACPVVAGACALMLSFNPEINIDKLEEYLLQSADPISSYICASGRLNIYEAMLHLLGPKGIVALESDIYSCSSTLKIKLLDADLAGNTTRQVIISTNGGDFETVLLTEQGSVPGIFEGTISTDSGIPGTEDGVVQISHGQNILVTYYDSDDGTGNPATVTDTAIVDCEAPVIFNVQTGVPGRQPKVTFETDEPATSRVLCGLICGAPYIIGRNDLRRITAHAVKLNGVFPQAEYFYMIEATDAAGNTSVDNNDGQCYTFTTTGPTGGDIYVPSQALTIQEAFDNSWDYGTVWLADGTYTGFGNRDIDFQGRPITVRSENGPENCIIDCQGSFSNMHRAFSFYNNEDGNSIIDGFTITNGYDNSYYPYGGGAIDCVGSSPVIRNCIISNNSAAWDGGAINNNNSNPTIINCVFIGNSAIGNDGGGINNDYSSPIIKNCIFSDNSAYDWGGGIRNIRFSSPVITNCIFSGNVSDEGSGIFNYDNSNPTILNCTFYGNSAPTGGSAVDSEEDSHATVINSIMWGNLKPEIAGSGYNISYSNIEGGWPGINNINSDPCFVDANNGNYQLQESSPCIDTGDPNYIAEPNEIDRDGNPRIINGIIDMGALEFQPLTPVELLLDLTDYMSGLSLHGGISNNLQAKL
ncbi:MAG: S8 family serine peptidase, partial [Planctomycetota bacterium]